MRQWIRSALVQIIWLVAHSVPSRYLNQCCVIVDWALRNKLQWNYNQNTKLVIHENASENVCEMTAILSRGRWVNRFIWNLHAWWEHVTWMLTMDDPDLLNTLCPSNAIWWHRSRSTLVQVMACWLTATSHYLHQCWLIINKVLYQRAISQENVLKLLM